jgi:hypothetical protein
MKEMRKILELRLELWLTGDKDEGQAMVNPIETPPQDGTPLHWCRVNPRPRRKFYNDELYEKIKLAGSHWDGPKGGKIIA